LATCLPTSNFFRFLEKTSISGISGMTKDLFFKLWHRNLICFLTSFYKKESYSKIC
jgi:hypothetical protein